MPIYEYRCEKGHNFDVLQRMADDPVEVCEVCKAPVQRVMHPVAVHFKGTGFYTTDYGKKKSLPAGTSSESKSESSSESKSSNGSDSSSSSSSSDSDSNVKKLDSSSSKKSESTAKKD